MELQLFGPVSERLLKDAYGVTLQDIREGDKTEQAQRRKIRLEVELERIGVKVKKIPGIKLNVKQKVVLMKNIASCYTREVSKMTWGELIMNYTKLSQYGFLDAANVMWNEMSRRGGIVPSDETEVVDSLCEASSLHMAANH